ARRAFPARSRAHPKELKARDIIAPYNAYCMREGLKALLVPHKAPVITDLNHMGDPTILPHKAASGFKGGPNYIAPRCTLEATIQTLGISANHIYLIGMAQNLNHQGPAQVFRRRATHNLLLLRHQRLTRGSL
ncbi:hypothetical protein OAN71_01090, partial [bacterium]|nr:hypothetical protein [bacterium]